MNDPGTRLANVYPYALRWLPQASIGPVNMFISTPLDVMDTRGL